MVGGLGPALLATAPGTLVLNDVFDQPPYSLGIDSPSTAVGLATFVAVVLTAS